MFRKKHSSHMHAHHPWHTHASHVLTHDFMYARGYTCTHCGRMGHLTKFCYDRIHDSNFANKFVWIRKGANPHRPKKIWVAKSTPILFVIGVDSHMT